MNKVIKEILFPKTLVYGWNKYFSYFDYGMNVMIYLIMGMVLVILIPLIIIWYMMELIGNIYEVITNRFMDFIIWGMSKASKAEGKKVGV